MRRLGHTRSQSRPPALMGRPSLIPKMPAFPIKTSAHLSTFNFFRNISVSAHRFLLWKANKLIHTFFDFFQNPLVWRNFSLKIGRRRWNGSTPVNCWQKSKVGLSGTHQIYHTNTALSHVNKSLIFIRHILSMCCIISEAVLYSGIKQRPLAALLIHFSALLSGGGMLRSLQRAVFKIPTIFRPILRLSLLVNTSLLPLQSCMTCTPSTSMPLRWLRCANCAPCKQEPGWNSGAVEGRRENRGCAQWNFSALTPNVSVRCIWCRAAKHNSALPRSLCLWQGEGGPRMGRAPAQSLALTVTESCCVYTAQRSTIAAGW